MILEAIKLADKLKYDIEQEKVVADLNNNYKVCLSESYITKLLGSTPDLHELSKELNNSIIVDIYDKYNYYSEVDNNILLITIIKSPK